jgi:hypothetical protein
MDLGVVIQRPKCTDSQVVGSECSSIRKLGVRFTGFEDEKVFWLRLSSFDDGEDQEWGSVSRHRCGELYWTRKRPVLVDGDLGLSGRNIVLEEVR